MIASVLALTWVMGCNGSEEDAGNVVWSFETGGPVDGTPTVADGVVYIVSDDGYLYALGAQSGSERWTASIGGGTSRPAAHEGVVFVGGGDGSVYALDGGSGSAKWSYSTGGAVNGGLVYSDGLVIFGGTDRNIYGLDAESGDKVWSYATSNEIHATPTVADGTVYLGSWDGSFYALDAATGAEKWVQALGDYVSSTAHVDGSDVFVGVELDNPTSDDGILFSLSADSGSRQWEFLTQEGLHVASGIVGDGAGTIYFGTQDWFDDGRADYLHAVSASSGAEAWAFEVGSSVVATPALGEGFVFFQDTSGFLYALDEEGTEQWQHETGGSKSSPVIDGGMVYIGGGETGSVYAIRVPCPSDRGC